MSIRSHRSWVLLTVLHNDQSTEEVVVDLQEVDYIRPSRQGGCYAHLKSGIHLHLVEDLISQIRFSLIQKLDNKSCSTRSQTTSVDDAVPEESCRVPE